MTPTQSPSYDFLLPCLSTTIIESPPPTNELNSPTPPTPTSIPPDSSPDSPTVTSLTSQAGSPSTTLPTLASAQINANPHSSHLSTPQPKPQILHLSRFILWSQVLKSVLLNPLIVLNFIPPPLHRYLGHTFMPFVTLIGTSYVDEYNALIVNASSSTFLQHIISSLNSEFSKMDLGALNYFLGIYGQRTLDGMFLSQSKYAEEILEWAHMQHCNPCRTLVDIESKFGPDGSPVRDPMLYLSLAGALQYLTFTRPNLSYAVQQVYLYMHDPREPHFYALKCILHYVQDPHPVIVFFWYNLLSWSSKRQATLSRSNAEAQYSGVSNVVAETAWVRNLLRELRTPLSIVTLINCDNVRHRLALNAVYLSSNLVQHQHTKYIEIDIHFVRDYVASGQHKFRADGTLSRYKARLIANGSNQQHAVDFYETFSPVVKPATIHTVLSLVVSRHWPIYQLNVKNAFLNGDLSETCTLELGLHLYASATTSLVGYTDADWAGCPSTRSSTFGYSVFLCDNLLSWSAKRQHTISRSSVEAEYQGVVNVVAKTAWLRNLLRELHSPLFTTTLVYCDNVSVVYMSAISLQPQQTKHIEIDIHFVRDMVKAGSGPAWLFDIDSLSRTMNYHPVLVENQSNSTADAHTGGNDHNDDIQKSVSPSCGDQAREQGEKAMNKDKGKSPIVTITGFKDLNEEFAECINNSSNEVSVVGPSVSAAGLEFTNSTNDFTTAGPSVSATGLKFTNSTNDFTTAGPLVSATELNYTNSTNDFSAAGPSNAAMPN
nr:hypothetical protein [Tanacetum cinerariifolium]